MHYSKNKINVYHYSVLRLNACCVFSLHILLSFNGLLSMNFLVVRRAIHVNLSCRGHLRGLAN